MKRKAYSRGERQEMIMNEFYKLIGADKVPGVTAYQMAKLLDLNSAKHVQKIMDDMVKTGMLEYSVQAHRPNVFKRIYRPKIFLVLEEPAQMFTPAIRIKGRLV